MSADLNEIMTGILNLLERTLGAHISIETLSSPGLARVMIDVNELETALINLATNARDAMPDGGDLSIKTANVILDAAEAERAKVDAGHYVALSVSDTGSGIAEDIIDDISEPFFTTKEVGKGSGLGLSMVQGFVTQSGGHLTIKSAPDRGTTVSILLPAITEALPAGATIDGADHPRGSGQKLGNYIAKCRRPGRPASPRVGIDTNQMLWHCLYTLMYIDRLGGNLNGPRH